MTGTCSCRGSLDEGRVTGAPCVRCGLMVPWDGQADRRVPERRMQAIGQGGKPKVEGRPDAGVKIVTKAEGEGD